MEFLQYETFASRAHEVFSIALGESNIDLRLVDVVRLKPHVFPGMRRDPFCLVFKSTLQTLLPQRTYSFKNDALGSLPIFIVPRGRDPEGTLYEAVFN